MIKIHIRVLIIIIRQDLIIDIITINKITTQDQIKVTITITHEIRGMGIIRDIIISGMMIPSKIRTQMINLDTSTILEIISIMIEDSNQNGIIPIFCTKVI